MLKRILFLLVLLTGLCVSCNKDLPQNEPQPPLGSDTTKILTLMDYDYKNGSIYDSTVQTLISIKTQDFTKYIITKTYPSEPGDTVSTTYKLNTKGQLLEVAYFEDRQPGYSEKDTYIWAGDNVVKIVSESSDGEKTTYNITYTDAGDNIRISYTEFPQPYGADTTFNGTEIESYSVGRSAFIVSKSDFKPLGIESEFYSYEKRYAGKPAHVSWDTSRIKFILSSTGDLQQRIEMHTASDSNRSGNIGMTERYKDSTIYTYERDNQANEILSNLMKNILGNKVLILSSFFSVPYNMIDIFPEMYDEYFLGNRPLNDLTVRQFVWRNEVPNQANGEIYYRSKYQNSYDSQNRLIKSVALSMAGDEAVYGFRIIWY